ncbi:MAG: hypothetical protein HYS98_06885 [Deltaproteobacteria bacterium]|nr:hypothetical protein [Deltaproteobacteria bacterium]
MSFIKKILVHSFLIFSFFLSNTLHAHLILKGPDNEIFHFSYDSFADVITVSQLSDDPLLVSNDNQPIIDEFRIDEFRKIELQRAQFEEKLDLLLKKYPVTNAPQFVLKYQKLLKSNNPENLAHNDEYIRLNALIIGVRNEIQNIILDNSQFVRYDPDHTWKATLLQGLVVEQVFHEKLTDYGDKTLRIGDPIFALPSGKVLYYLSYPIPNPNELPESHNERLKDESPSSQTDTQDTLFEKVQSTHIDDNGLWILDPATKNRKLLAQFNEKGSPISTGTLLPLSDGKFVIATYCTEDFEKEDSHSVLWMIDPKTAHKEKLHSFGETHQKVEVHELALLPTEDIVYLSYQDGRKKDDSYYIKYFLWKIDPHTKKKELLHEFKDGKNYGVVTNLISHPDGYVLFMKQSSVSVCFDLYIFDLYTKVLIQLTHFADSAYGVNNENGATIIPDSRISFEVGNIKISPGCAEIVYEPWIMDVDTFHLNKFPKSFELEPIGFKIMREKYINQYIRVDHLTQLPDGSIVYLKEGDLWRAQLVKSDYFLWQ